MSIAFGTGIERRAPAAPRGGAGLMSPPQILRLALLVLIAVFCAGVSTSLKSGHGGAPGGRAVGPAPAHASR
jgi:hypothetical protein